MRLSASEVDAFPRTSTEYQVIYREHDNGRWNKRMTGKCTPYADIIAKEIQTTDSDYGNKRNIVDTLTVVVKIAMAVAEGNCMGGEW